MRCDSCNAVEGRRDDTLLTKAPCILVVDLMRWVNVGGLGGPEKLQRLVKAPSSLNMTRYVDSVILTHKQGRLLYDLRGIVHHVGSDTQTGHCE